MLVVVNVGMFIGEFVVLSLVLLFDKQTYQNVQPYYLNALYAVAVVIFGFYGTSAGYPLVHQEKPHQGPRPRV